MQLRRMAKSWRCGAALALVFIVGTASSNPPPPLQPDPISLDTASPSGPYGAGYSTNYIYGEAAGGGTGGVDVIGGTGPVMHVFCSSFGVGPLWRPGFGNNVDGISNNEIPAQQHVIYFSGDDQSVGVVGTHYNHQAVRLQAAGDRFVTNGFTNTSVPAVVFGGAPPAAIVGPVLAGPVNLLSANQTRYNEIPTIQPAQFNTYVPPPGTTRMDDMDALEITPLDLTGDQHHDMPLYFTLDAASPDLNTVPGGATGADILVSPPFAPPIGVFSVFAPFPMLGLTPQDEVDALAVWDVNGDMQVAPGIDYAIFSLAPGSPTLAQMGFSPADVLATAFTGAVPKLYVPAVQLGLLPTDNIDGLDVEPFAGPASVEVWEEIIEEPLIGDYNDNGVVDAADYVLWRETFRGPGIPPPSLVADGDGDGDVDEHDYEVWRAHFGQTAVLVAGSNVDIVASGGIPEPTAFCLICVYYTIMFFVLRRGVRGALGR